MRRRAIMGLTAAVVAVTLAGCGSTTLSAHAVRTRAALLCTTAIRRSDKIAMPSSTSAGAAFLAKGITVFGSEVQALHKLAPPHELASAYRTALSTATQQLDALIATEHDLRAGGDPVIAIKQLDLELGPINARDRQAWRAVGVPDCIDR